MTQTVMSVRRAALLAVVVLGVVAVVLLLRGGGGGGGGRPGEERDARRSAEEAYRANNVGVAQLEQFDYPQAIASFRRAIEIDARVAAPRLNLAIALYHAGELEGAAAAIDEAVERLPAAPQAHYVAGLVARGQGRRDDAVAAFERVLEIDPFDPGSLVNLAQLQIQERRYAEAIVLLRRAVEAEPYNATALYNLALALTRSGETDEGSRRMGEFERMRSAAYTVTYSNNYLEQGGYAEAIVSTGAERELVDREPPAVTFVDATRDMLPPAGTAVQGSTGVTLFDADADGDLDLLELGARAPRFFRNRGGRFEEARGDSWLAGSSGGGTPALGAAADLDNDGRADILLAGPFGHRLLRQGVDGRFEDRSAAAGFSRAALPVGAAALVDVDHDGDLDLFLAGSGDRPRNQLWRNNGNGTYSEITAAAQLLQAPGRAVGIAPADYDGGREIDLLVAGSGGVALLRNLRDGTFRDVAAEVGLGAIGTISAVAAGDIDKDGLPDFFLGRPDAPGLFATSTGRGRLKTSGAPPASAGARAAQFIDYDNDGLLDLLALTASGARLARGTGDGWMDVSDRALPVELRRAGDAGPGASALACGDLDGDGDTDVVAVTDGGLGVWRNDGGHENRSLRVQLAGRASNRGGVGAKVDLRAGSLRHRLELAAATPAVAPADLLFGLGGRQRADVVRVLWPSGILQAETTLGTGVGTASPEAARTASLVSVIELDRKPSSCPYLYTWNGSRFEFVTDFMGGGEMGYWVAPATHNVADPDEYVRIERRRLLARDGRYEMRVTNELEEALFVDRVQLLCVRHPEGTELFANEALRAPPRPPLRLFATRDARPPARVLDHHGHDVSARVAEIDREYADDFALERMRGHARRHALVVHLAPRTPERSVLLLTGWTDYAFSSDNVAASQSGLSLQSPSLEARDATGVWRTIAADLGVPVGRPQTIAIDLAGRVPSGSLELRIATSMRIYWDRIRIASYDQAPLEIERLDPVRAELRWRGFSAEITPDGREPFAYDYDRALLISPWKTPIGRYTREGDVRPLLLGLDDRFVVSRPGDEIALAFDAGGAPPPGLTHTFFLYADGFSKEMDPNSASPHAVEPLPFHAMTAYPYRPPEAYPSTPAHLEYIERYNTRVVTKPIPSLERHLEPAGMAEGQRDPSKGR